MKTKPFVFKPKMEFFVLESLESRIAPATLLPDGKTVTFIDTDGDEVTIKFNQKLPPGTDIANVVKFEGSDFGDSGPQTLSEIDLTAWGFQPGKSEKFRVEVVTKKDGPGNGTTDVGSIKADNLNINTIKVSGDLGKITAGDESNPNSIAIKTLEVGSIGTTATSVQTSIIAGGVSSFKVIGDVKNANIMITAGPNTPGIGKLEIGGKLDGTNTDNANNSGQITVNGNVTNATITGGVEGGGGTNSGTLIVNGNITALNVGGDVHGGSGEGSGKISASGNIGIFILNGDVTGGNGTGSGRVEAGGSVKKADIKGGVQGGSGDNSGSISFEGAVNSVAIGSINGGSAEESGNVLLKAGAKTVKVGNITGGEGDRSGLIASETAPILNISTGDILGGNGESSGMVYVAVGDYNGDGKNDIVVKASFGALEGGFSPSSGVVMIEPFTKTFVISSITGGNIDDTGCVFLNDGANQVTVLGEIIGGLGNNSGCIYADGDIGTAKIAGDLRGGDGNNSGIIVITNNLGTINVGSNLIGGSGSNSGIIHAGGNVGTAKITGDLIGGNGNNSGVFIADGNTGIIIIVRDLRGGFGENSGVVHVLGNLGTANLGGMVGSNSDGSCSLQVGGNAGKVNVKFGLFNGAEISVGGDLNSCNVSGDILGGGTLEVSGNLGTASVKGNIQGSATTPFVFNVAGASTPDTKKPVVKKFTAVKKMHNVQFITGYLLRNPSVNNPDAFIDSFSVKGDFINSSIAVGVEDVDGTGFGSPTNQFVGNAGDSSIGGLRNLTIGGHIDNQTADFIGIVAAHVTKAKIAGKTIPLNPGPRNDEITNLDGATNAVLSEFPVA